MCSGTGSCLVAKVWDCSIHSNHLSKDRNVYIYDIKYPTIELDGGL